jgi:hypothetical protein
MPDDPHRKEKIPHHPLNDFALLAILVSKNRDVGLHEVKKFGQHGGYTPEMPWSPIPTSAPGTVHFLHPGGSILGIEPQGTE